MDQSKKTYTVNQLISKSSIYYVGSVIIMLSSFISMPILTRIFTKAEYGTLSLIMLTMLLVLVPAKFGFQNSAVYYFDEFKLQKRPEGLETFYSTLLWGSFSISLVVVVVFLFGGNMFSQYLPNKNLLNYTKLISALVITEAMFLRVRNFLRVEQRSLLFIIIGILHGYGRIAAGLFYFYFIDRTLHGFLVGSLLTNIIILFICIVFMGWFNLFKISFFSGKFLKQCMKYGYPFIGIESASLLMKYIDRYLIDYYLGTSAVGVYSVPGNLCMAISSGIFSSIWLAITPMYMKIYRTDGENKTSDFVSKSINLLFFLFIPIVFGLSATSYDVIQILASVKYIESATVIPYLVTGAALWGLTPIYATGFYIKKKTKVYSRIVLASVVFSFIMNIFMIPRLGLKGAAITSLLTYSMTFLATAYLSSFHLKLKTDFVSLMQYILAGGTMYVVLQNISMELNITNLILKIILGTIVYLCLVLAMNAKIRNYLRQTLIEKFFFEK